MRTAAAATAAFLALILSASAAGAGPKYINDRLEVTVRSGPGLKYRIISTLSTGSRVETVEKKDGWMLVRIPGGKEGWVLNRYLSDDVPDSVKYESLKKKWEPLKERVAKLESSNEDLRSENQALAEDLKQARRELSETKKKFKELKESSADYLELKSKHKKLSSTLEEKNKKIEELEKRVSDAFLSKALKWFLAGAGVLLIGIIIGASSGRRKRSSLL